jgi:16S rRNA (guanine527-N7)-methyltransferase
LNSSNETLARLAELLGSWPGVVGRPDPRLVDDSLALLAHLGSSRRLVDVGSGGGLPGLALKIARPDLELTLIEANHRKAAFLQHAAAVLGLEGVEVVARRAEEAGRDSAYRDHFDAAVARALAPMPVLVELCLPLVRVGGRLLAMKAAAEAEVEAALPAIAKLGGELVAIEAAPTAIRERGQVVVVAKIAPTPDEFPRRIGVPARRPLGK